MDKSNNKDNFSRIKQDEHNAQSGYTLDTGTMSASEKISNAPSTFERQRKPWINNLSTDNENAPSAAAHSASAHEPYANAQHAHNDGIHSVSAHVQNDNPLQTHSDDKYTISVHEPPHNPLCMPSSKE